MPVFNPLMRLEQRSPLARVLPWATMDFTGRKSGRAMSVIVYWHETGDGGLVFSPNAWRFNFVEPRPATIRKAGRTREYSVTLHRDHAEVAAAMNELRAQGMRVPGGVWVPKQRAVTTDDLAVVSTELLRFRLLTTA